MGDTGSELEFTDDDIENEQRLLGSQDRSIATDFSSISSGRSGGGLSGPKSPAAAAPRDGNGGADDGGAKRSSASMLMMGRTKRQRTKERIESSQSSTGDDSGTVMVASSSQESSISKTEVASPSRASSFSSSSSRRRTMQSRKTKPLSMRLATVSEYEIASTGIERRSTTSNMKSLRNDHFSIKDMAQSQMLLDEYLYLCESIVGQRHPLEPLESLAEMLSDRESRRHLFFSSASQGPSHALQGVVSIFAWVNQFVQNNEGDGSGGSPGTLPASQSSYETVSTVPSNFNQHGVHHQDRQPILNAAKVVAYFVSLDCTLCPEAAHSTKNNHGSAVAARRVRHTLLANPECMQGLFQLVLDDPLTEHIRDDRKAREKGKDILLDDSSSSTPSSVSVSSKVDPTLQGRLKRRQLKLERETSFSRETTPEAKSDASLSFASSSAPVAKKSLQFHTNGRKNDVFPHPQKSSEEPELVVKVRFDTNSWPGASWRSISLDLAEQSFQHTCRDECQSSYIISSVAPLVAIRRIISAKHEKYDESAIDDDQGTENGSSDPDNGGGDDDDYNPIVASNKLLSSSGALPLLARSLANSLVAAIVQTRLPGGGCEGCVRSMGDRICSLASVADAASLFNVGNRIEMCNEGFTSETNGYLVVAMISFLRAQLGNSVVLLNGTWGDTVLSLLKTLTSLSHENEVVAKELKSKLSDVSAVAVPKSSERTGLGVLVAFLRECVAQIDGKNDRESKLLYDCQIYCLSIMTNIASSRGCIEVLSEMSVPRSEGRGDVLFLQWLTRWLVSLTKSFHSAILESSFGTTSSKHKDRILTLPEEEGLVASGKGFIFLSRIIVEGRGTETIQSILQEIPGNTLDEKMKMIRNTLKAFMSFYQQSIGGLSVAITAPLQVLLKKLDAFEVPAYEVR